MFSMAELVKKSSIMPEYFELFVAKYPFINYIFDIGNTNCGSIHYDN